MHTHTHSHTHTLSHIHIYMHMIIYALCLDMSCFLFGWASRIQDNKRTMSFTSSSLTFPPALQVSCPEWCDPTSPGTSASPRWQIHLRKINEPTVGDFTHESRLLDGTTTQWSDFYIHGISLSLPLYMVSFSPSLSTWYLSLSSSLSLPYVSAYFRQALLLVSYFHSSSAQACNENGVYPQMEILTVITMSQWILGVLQFWTQVKRGTIHPSFQVLSPLATQWLMVILVMSPHPNWFSERPQVVTMCGPYAVRCQASASSRSSSSILARPETWAMADMGRFEIQCGPPQLWFIVIGCYWSYLHQLS